MHSSSEEQINAVTRILRYLKLSLRKWIMLKKKKEEGII
jgi:hypothetical protein